MRCGKQTASPQSASRLIQRFLNYSVNPQQYRVALLVNVLLPLCLAAHLTRIDGWDDASGAPALGFLAYTFGEYAFHRWIAHGFMERYLDVHHDAPDRPFTTPWFAAPLFVFVAANLLTYITGPAFASAFFLGAALLHLYADLQHYAHHHTDTHRFLRAHHLQHHHNPTVNFGLTTRLWDALFGTFEKESTHADAR